MSDETPAPLTALSELVGRAKVKRHNLARQIAAEGTQEVTQHLPACRCDLCNGRPRRRARGTSPQGGFLLSDLQADLTSLDLVTKRAVEMFAEVLGPQ